MSQKRLESTGTLGTEGDNFKGNFPRPKASGVDQGCIVNVTTIGTIGLRKSAKLEALSSSGSK
jgi:hypothetical protein